MTTLDCNGNNLTSLDVTALTNLQSLNCSYNQLATLNTTGLTNLLGVGFEGNTISDLDLSSSHNLYGISFGNVTNTLNLSNTSLSMIVGLMPYFSIGTLNMSHCTNLTHLEVPNRTIHHINLTGCTALTVLDVEHCLLNELDVSSLTNLTSLFCRNNLFQTLDISNNHNLTDAVGAEYMSDSLQYLYAKNGHSESMVDMAGCPNLIYACVDESEITQAYNPPWALVTTYCTFVPGGDYNTITGTVTFDANNDGCDSADLPKSLVRININDGTTSAATFTNYSGNYSFYPQAGSFVITPSIENPTWYNFSPASATIPFANNSNNTTTQSFCLAPNGIHPDVEVMIVPTFARPGFDAHYEVVYKNKGNQILSGNITFGYDDAVLDFVTSTVAPSLQSTGLLTFNYTNLLPFENRSFNITLHVNAPTDSPAVNIGDQLTFTATANPTVGDETPLDNTIQLHKPLLVHSTQMKLDVSKGT